MSQQRWRRGESRDRLLAATLAAIAEVGPRAVSGRQVAKEAAVQHPQIQQMYGSVDELIEVALCSERDRFVSEVFDSDHLPSPTAIIDYPLFWRAMAQVLLDPGPVDLSRLANGGPVGILTARLQERNPEQLPVLTSAVATAWAAAPLGALIFRQPLQRGLGISSTDWDRCWERLGGRLIGLASSNDLPSSSPAPPSNMAPVLVDAKRGRERLLQAAELLLTTRLETSITGRELAATAGVNHGLVSHYFGSKTALFDQVLANLHQAFLADVLDVSLKDPDGQGFWVHTSHRAFFRTWASRLLRESATPEFELLGMERLMAHLIDARGITRRQKGRRLEAAGDAMTSVALRLGWTILRPLPAAATPTTISEIDAALASIHRTILDAPTDR